MVNIQALLRHDLCYFDMLTNRVDRPWGTLFYNVDNKLSWDSNHAHIQDLSYDPEVAVMEITSFYRERGVTPRIYNSYLDGELDILRPVLESNGYKINIHADELMIFNSDVKQEDASSPPVCRVTVLTPDIVELTLSENNAVWSVGAVNRLIKDTRYRLFGYYYEGKCVAKASLSMLDVYSRIEDVETHHLFRNRGFGLELIRYITAFHTSSSSNLLYLWAVNPVAIRMYKKAGFASVPVNKPSWDAVQAPD